MVQYLNNASRRNSIFSVIQNMFLYVIFCRNTAVYIHQKIIINTNIWKKNFKIFMTELKTSHVFGLIFPFMDQFVLNFALSFGQWHLTALEIWKVG